MTNSLTDAEARQTIPVVVINLDRDSDRLAWHNNNCLRIGLSFERIAAVDAKDESMLTEIEELRSPSLRLSYTEAACILSHRKAWQYLLNTQHSYLAVFEDDLHLSNDLPQLLNHELIPKNTDLIKLEVPSGKVSFARKPSASLLGRKLHRLITKAYGAGAYIISRRCASKLLKLTEHCAEPVDVTLFDPLSPIWQELGVQQVIPAPCIQDVNLCRLTPSKSLFESTIERERKIAKIVRQNENKARKKSVPLKKLWRYLWCIYQGANPLRYKNYIPLDLGHPNAATENRYQTRISSEEQST